MSNKRFFTILGPTALLMLITMMVPISLVVEPQTHHFTVDSRQFEYDPGRINVRQGDRVVIDFTALDVVHGFHLDGYGIDERIEPGVTRRISFTADKAGKFRYRCSVSCGPMHPFMIGELVVGPNIPLLRAAGTMIIGLAGMLLYLWFNKGETNESLQNIP